MLDLHLPQGTSFDEALTRYLPSWHRQAVPDDRKQREFTIAVEVRRLPRGRYTLRIRGRDLEVEAGLPDRGQDLWIATEKRVVERVVADMCGPHLLVPRAMPGESPVRIVTDPLLIERVLMSQGIVHATIEGIPEGKDNLWVAMGVGRRYAKHIDPEEATLRMTAPYELFRRVAGGQLDPSKAISTPEMRIDGSRMLAMQLALVSTLLIPAKG